MPSRRLGAVAQYGGSFQQLRSALVAGKGLLAMPSNYTIVQYRPDPASEERLNIGVIAWDADGAHAVFVETWERVRSFGGCDVGFLREFAQSMQSRLAEEDLLVDELTDELVGRLVGDLAHSVQLTPAREAHGEAPKLISSLSARFLYSPPPKPKGVRNRRTATRLAYRAIRDAVGPHAPKPARRLVHLRRNLQGKLGEHRFDVVLANGKPLAAVDALSFEVASNGNLQRELDATAWALDDVRHLDEDLPLAVFALPPPNGDAERVFLSASKIFRALGAKVFVDERAMGRWAKRQAGRRPA